MRPPITPPQSASPLEGNLFTRVWYLFFNRLAQSLSIPITTGTLSTAALAPLGADAQAFFYASDYEHWYFWNGSAWAFADGGSEYIVAGTPNGGLWAPCDGGTYSFAQSDGSLSSHASIDLRAGAGEPIFIASAAATGARTAASQATWDAAAKTGIENTKHTHDVHVVGNNSYAAGAFGAVADQTVTSTTDSVDHHHPLTDADAKLNKPSEAAGGLPLHIALAHFQRR